MTQNQMAQNLTISKPSRRDIPLLDEFFQFILTDTFERNGYFDLTELRDSEIELKKEMFRTSVERDASEQFFLVAKLEDGIVVGTISVGPANEDIIHCTHHAYEGLLEIGSLFIHPAYQKQGIASRLILEVEKILIAQDIKSYCLDSGYQLAQKTWTQKFGKPQYLIKDHWGEGADHMIWKVEIQAKTL